MSQLDRGGAARSPRRGDGGPHRDEGMPRRRDGAPQRNEGMPRRRDGVPPSGDGLPHRLNAVPSPEGVDVEPDPGDRPAGARGVDVVPWEARPFQGQRAGIVTRTAANVVDFSLLVGVLAGGYAAWCAFRFLINPTKFSFPTVSFVFLLVCYAVVLFVYFTASWATTGRTYGDHLLGLRVVNFRGDRLRWAGAVVRAGFSVILPIGLYWAVLSPTNRSVQDTVLRTSVLYDWTTGRRTT